MCLLLQTIPALRELPFPVPHKLMVTTARNRQSTFSPLKPFVPLPSYFKSEWSYAQYRIPSQSSHISISTSLTRSPNEDVVDEEKCVVGWIQVPLGDREDVQEYQLIALTYTGGWYRVSLPGSKALVASATLSPTAVGPMPASPPSIRAMSAARPRSSSGVSFASRPDKGKERERDKEGKERDCVLQEFRRFGRWDGWG